MTDLFKKRLSSHLAEMLKYLRLVFTDYFVLAILFMIGAVGYYYSQNLNRLQMHIWWAPIVATIYFVLVSQLGRLATLVADPDAVFLLPREAEMPAYFMRGFRYSIILAEVIQIVLWFVSIPFLQRTLGFGQIDFGALLVAVIATKVFWLLGDVIRKFRLSSFGFEKRVVHRFCLPLLIFAVIFWGNSVVGAAGAIFLLAIFAVLVRNINNHPVVNWHIAIDDENSRMHSLYTFFNLFTDVPMIQSTVKRRRYLDIITDRIQLKSKNSFLFLYAHGLSRDTEMSGLFIRLTVLGAVVLAFIKNGWLPIVLPLVFIYLIGFQLIPFYFHFDDNAFVHIYPFDNRNQVVSFQKVILMMLIFVAVIMAVVVTIVNFNNLATVGILIVLEAVEIWLFVYGYLPRRINKSINSRN
ncbi:ABC transporter permease [Lentilactobacillus sp. Marseille-Q4993]|uniref:ABC transporter permease n=1 Tax=Lentilactobacillus sp. Marseille-Q4993 TaxID=3039492 RepID=UPI0024BBF9E8|nr:ABC transporter permease [Lentilactobacillus sp. Marseille-Q4993]